ncbi:MAG: ferredoxin [Actinomycetia bacterium]|nr:ferredoxin [Actinomycetes bacterium]
MRIVLDVESCTGHGRCYALAPAVFAPDDMGHCEVVTPEPTSEQEELARAAVATCPEDALGIEE